MLWFKNIAAYRFTRETDITPEELEEKLTEYAFVPCGHQDRQKVGWTTALGKYGQTLVHCCHQQMLVCYQKEEKLLPASVINEELVQRVDKQELNLGRSLRKAEKDTLKDDIVMQLLPRAFTKRSSIYALIMPQQQLVLVNTASATKAEEVLALLRKSIGSLPVTPATTQVELDVQMTQWLKEEQAPDGFEFGDEAEFRSLVEEGGIIRCKQQDLISDEIKSHLAADKVVTKLALSWKDRLSFILHEDLTIKRIKFSDELKDQNDDIDKEDMLSRLDADLTLMSGEFAELLPELLSLGDDLIQEA